MAASASEFARAQASLQKQGAELVGRDDVLAVGLGLKTTGGRTTDTPSVTVFVPKKLPLAELSESRRLPASIRSSEGAESVVDVAELGRAMAPLPPSGNLPALLPQGQLGLYGPVAGAGISCAIGIPGTLGLLARSAMDPSGGYEYLISCNHVLAHFNFNWPGVAVLQPSAWTGGHYPTDTIAYLSHYVPLRFGFGAGNFMDAGAARLAPMPFRRPLFHRLAGTVGLATATELYPGDPVQKVGAASGLTWGRVVATHALLKIDYWTMGMPGSNTLFFDQIITTPMAVFGDSGALLVDGFGRAAGLLFGGSPFSTFFNPISPVLASLGLRL